jgi:high affinity Mn2+ porin
VRRGQSKFGFGVGFDQSVSQDDGVFVRGSWNDGQTETYAFTEIERSVVGGFAVKGRLWRRPGDTVGLAGIANGLSSAHREYLAAGGLGAFIGDGAISYRTEQIVEAYYSINAFSGLWLTADFQHIVNPAYNADRGPVNVYGGRMHAEF